MSLFDKRKNCSSLLHLGSLILLLSGCGGGGGSDSGGTTSGTTTTTTTITETSDVVTTPAFVINEVVAKADGDDWFEIFVSGDEAINLGDYSIADSNDIAIPLPSVALSSGDYLRIYATDIAPADGSEFVDLGLGGNDNLSAYLDDSLVDFIDWDAGDALFGFSYGRFPDGSGEAQTLEPSPSTSNISVLAGPLVINEVLASDIASGEDWFELYNNGSSSISLDDYSVVDDDDTQTAVVLPSVDLAVGEYIVIYATSVDPGDHYVDLDLDEEDSLSLILNDETIDYLEWDASEAPGGYSYGLYADGSFDEYTLEPTPALSNELAVAFSTTTVEDFFIVIDAADLQAIYDDPADEVEYPASITYRGVTLDEVSIRTKGNSSLNAVVRDPTSNRYSFKVDMNDYVSGQKLLNLKKINLNNNFLDPSYMREHLSYDLMRSLDLPAPQTAPANIYINGELHGFYTLVEQVDDQLVEREMDRGDGDLYKPDGTGSDLIWISEDFSDYTGVELKENEDTTNNSKFIAFLDELNNGSDYESVIDIDSVLRYLAVSTLLSNLDSYQGNLAHNYYLYEQGGVFSVIPWDLNESFGTFSQGCTNPLNLLIDEPTSTSVSQRPLIEKLLDDTTNLSDYHGYLQQLLDGDFAAATVAQNIEDYADLIRSHVSADPSAFYSATQFESSLDNNVSGIYGLTSFSDDRSTIVANQLSGSSASTNNGNGGC